MVSKNVKKFFLTFPYLGKADMVLGKKVAIFAKEWGRKMGRKSPDENK